MKRLKTFNRKTYKNLSESKKRVYSVMRSGSWISASKIKTAVNGDLYSDTGLRRMRDLREWFTIEKRKEAGPWEWEYRLVRGKNYNW